VATSRICASDICFFPFAPPPPVEYGDCDINDDNERGDRHDDDGGRHMCNVCTWSQHRKWKDGREGVPNKPSSPPIPPPMPPIPPPIAVKVLHCCNCVVRVLSLLLECCYSVVTVMLQCYSAVTILFQCC
jgi:hypothetical protein